MKRFEQNDDNRRTLSQTLALGAALVAEAALWLSGFSALVGLFSRERLPIDSTQASLITLSLMLIVAGILILSRFRTFSRSQFEAKKGATNRLGSLRRHSVLIPVFFLGMILPLPFFFLYAAFLTLLELLFRHRAATTFEADEMKKFDEEFDEESDEESEKEFDENRTQQIIRRRENGRDCLEASFLVEFDERQLTSVVHVPFCPVFDTVPKVEAFLLDDAEAKLILSEANLFGIRIEVKRSSSATERLHLAVIAEGQ